MRRHTSQVSARTVWTVGLNGLGVLLLGWLVLQLRPVFTLVAVSLLLAIAIEPLLVRLERLGIPRGWALGLVTVVLLGVGFLLVTTLIPVVQTQISLLREEVPAAIDKVRTTRWVQDFARRLGFEGEFPSALRLDHGVSTVVGVIGFAGGVLAEGVAVVALTGFGLLYGDELYQAALRTVRPSRRAHADSLLRRMRDAIAGYVLGTLLMTALGALVTGVLLAVMGVPFFLPIALAMLVLGLIPLFGSFVGALLVAFSTLAAGGLNRALLALALFLLYQQIAAHLLSPLVQQRTLQMNPLLLTAVLIAGAGLDGLVGATLALPFAAAVQELLHDVQERRERRWRRPRDPPPIPPSPGLPRLQ